MNNATESTFQQAKNIIQTTLDDVGFTDAQIVLFGSRARNTYTSQSDWDFLVVISQDITRPHKHLLIKNIKRELARHIIPNDIIIVTRKEYDEKCSVPGMICRNASLDGVRV